MLYTITCSVILQLTVINMAIREFLLWPIFTCVIMIYCANSIACQERVKWIALGDEIRDDDNGSTEVDRYNVSIPVSAMTEVNYATENGKRISSIIASASKMNGYVSLERGGLDEEHVTIRYQTEKGAEDEFIVFIESCRPKPLVLNDNSARTGNVAVVVNDIRNWTTVILQQALSNDYKFP